MSQNISAGNVTVQISGDGSGWQREVKSAIERMDQFEKEITAIQGRINAQFNSIGQDTSNQIKEQMEVRARLEEEYYAATHSRKEIELRNNQIYYDSLRQQFKEHQEMLTLIHETEAAKRAEIERRYQESYSPMASFAVVRSYMRAAGVLYTLTSTLRGVTEAHKAIREGGDPFYVYVRALPFIGGMAEIFKNLLWEITGVNEQLEMTQNKIVATENIRNKIKDFSNRKELLSADSWIEKEIIAEKQAHEERIQQLQDDLRASENVNLSIKMRISDLEQEKKLIQERNNLQYGAYTGMSGVDIGPGLFDKIREGKIDNQINTLKSGLQDVHSIQKLINEETELYNEKIRKIKEKPILDMIKALEEQRNALSKSETELAIYNATLLGATDAQIENIRKLTEEIEKLKEEKKQREENIRVTRLHDEALRQWARSAISSVQTPMEKMNETIKKVNESVSKGILTQVEGVRITQKARQDMIEEMDKDVIAFSKRVKESIKTPQESFIEFQKQLTEAVKKGYLTQEEAQKAYQKEYEEMMKKLEKDKKKDEKITGGEARYVSGYQSISGMSISGIDEMVLKQERMNAILEKIERNTRESISPTFN